MIDLSEAKRTIERKKSRLRMLNENLKQAEARGMDSSAVSLRHEVVETARLIQRLEQEVRMATPLDARSDSSAYSRGSYFSSSNG
jgi:hypothetical protein